MKEKKRIQRLISWLLVMGLIFTNMLPASVTKAETSVQSEETGTAAGTNAYAIYPIPQNITYPEGEFTLSNTVAIVAEEGVDEYTIAFLKRVLENYDVAYELADAVQTGKSNIVLGVQGSNGVAASYVTQNVTITDTALFTKNDAYVLDAKNGNIVIQGKDADSVYYGVATLQMMFSSFDGAKFLNTHIEDFATVATRGYVEGFYGAWEFEEREDLMRFGGNYKMNSYVYAAKGDSYHTNKWADLYPADTLAKLENLVKVGNETKVKFVWSVHLGNFFGKFSETDVDGKTATFTDNYNKLIAKFQQLYDIGVREFHILNDDFGSGSNTMVVKVLNLINKDLKAMGCPDITYCPQGYNKAWSGNGAELEALKHLDADIAIYWTGDDVNAPITQETINFVTERSEHAPDFWLNYPVNEHAKSGIFLGDITYYARDNVTGLAGFHSNPCKYPYASMVGLYQLAALVWNNNNYSAHAQEVWTSAFDYLQPEVKDSYYTIANNISNAPNSSRVGNGFPESNYLKEKLETVQELVAAGEAIKANEEAQAVYAEFKNILDAIADFRANCANQGLITELDPWLKSLSDIASAGRDVLESLFALEEGNASVGWEKLSSASKYYDTIYSYVVDADLPDTYAKAGSKRLAPFVSTMINAAKNKLTPILNPDDDTVTPVIFAKLGGAEKAEDNNTKKMYDGDETTYASWSVVQQQGDYFGLDLGRVITVRDITVLQGQTDTHHDIFHNAVLQYSEDKVTWTDIECTPELDGHLLKVEGLDIKARYVRYYLKETGYNGKPDFWTHVREFTVNKKVAQHDRVYTNVDALKETPLTIEDAKISIRDLTNLTLQAGEYVGIKLVKPVAVTEFTKELSNASDLVLEYSYNGQDWTEAGTVENVVGVKYLRLMNKTNAAVTTNLQKIEMNVKYLKAEPILLTSTVSGGFSQGKSENIFDGDLSTYVLTGSAQTKDSYITFDLGNMMEVHDVTAVTTDGAQRFYNAKIQISKDNVQWTDAAVVANDNSVFEVPYRYVRGNGNGVLAKYLRIYFTGANSNALKLHEIQINKNVAANSVVDEISSSLDGNLQLALDKDISTLFAANATANAYVEYRISDNTNIKQVSILQGTAGTGKAIAVTANGNVELGVLDKSVNTFDTTEIAPITAVRIEWSGTEQVAIHEISVSRGNDVSDDIGTYVDPIILNATEQIRNLAIGKEVTVSGTTAGNKDKVNDGDTSDSSKWDSNNIKDSTGADTGDAWVCIKLGEEAYAISQVVAHYFNKVYPTSYEVQVSDDGEEWETVKTLTKDNNGPTHPVDTIDFATPVVGKYVRLFFKTINTAAAGHGVGVKELEIYGKKATDEDISGTPDTPSTPGTSATLSVSGVTAGSQHATSGNRAAASAVDGDPSTIWHTNWNDDVASYEKHWITLDLGKNYMVDTLRYLSRNSGGTNGIITKYEIYISLDGTNFTLATTGDWAGELGTWYEATMTAKEARYVKLQTVEAKSDQSNKFTSAAEIEIKGYEKSAGSEEPDTTVAVTGVTLNKTAITLKAGANETLTATITPANASNKEVTWTSSNTAVATVDATGKVVAIAEGTATITVKSVVDTTKTATCTVTVTKADDSGNEGGNQGGNSGDSEKPDTPHTHTYGEWKVVKAATCTEAGKEERVCTCGVKEERTLPVMEHKMDAGTETTKATCKAEGVKTFKCTNTGCTHTTTEAIAKLTTHTWDEGTVTTKPTATKAGVKTYTCSVCNAKDTEAIAALGAPKKGTKLVVKGATYKVTKSHVKNGTVTFVSTKKNATTITVPNTIKVDGITYKVTSVEKNAFKNQSKATKITIGSNVTKIGATAFTGCKKLKTITINSTKLTKSGVAKNAFKGLGKTTKIKVPKAKVNSYKKIFKSKGLSSKVKVTK